MSVIPLSLAHGSHAAQENFLNGQPWGVLPDLTTPEHLLVLVIRKWVAAYNQRKPPETFIGDAFSVAEVKHLYQPFDKLMTVIAFTSEIDLDVRCLKCRELGDGEKRILTIIRLAQERRFNNLQNYLNGWLRGSGQRFVAETAEFLGTELGRKGLRLPLRINISPTLQ
jgi:hypothetical protein